MKDNYPIILNVVAYGYHEYPEKSDVVFARNGNIRVQFLKDHLDQEIEMLHEWTSILGGVEAKRKLITVVSKADLWWEKRPDVLAYYQTGAYAKSLNEATYLQPAICEWSSVRKLFFGKMELSGQFDDVARAALRKRFFETLFDAMAD